MSAYRRTWWAIGAAALVVSACKDSTAPQLSNPQQLGSNLQTVSSVFGSPAFQSFGALDSAPGSPVAASTPAGALLAATSVAAPHTPRQPYADAPARLHAFRTTATALGGRLSAQVIPSTVWGKTYVWDVTAHAYAEDPSPAVAGPSTGVRLILYAIDPITRHVVESPLTAVGYVDLVDQSSGNTNQLEVIVKDGTPPNGTTYVDYTVSATVTGSPASSFDATAVGFVTDGTRRIDFNATFSATNLATDNPDVHAVGHWALDNPALTIDLDEKLDTPNANEATITIDFTYTYAGETVHLTGTVSVVQSPVSVTANVAVYENGAVNLWPSSAARPTRRTTVLRSGIGTEPSSRQPSWQRSISCSNCRIGSRKPSSTCSILPSGSWGSESHPPRGTNPRRALPQCIKASRAPARSSAGRVPSC